MKSDEWCKMTSDKSNKGKIITSDRKLQVTKIGKCWKVTSGQNYKWKKVKREKSDKWQKVTIELKWQKVMSDEKWQVTKSDKGIKVTSDRQWQVMEIGKWWRVTSGGKLKAKK